MEKKLIVIISGRSGVGKSTLMQIAANEFMVRKVSSVEQVKKVAAVAGWNGVKDLPGRQLLSDLKQAMVTYDDSPYKALLQEYKIFTSGGDQILFVPILEPQEIQKFAEAIRAKGGKVVTLLVTRKQANKLDLAPDNATTQFTYDHIFENDKPIKESGAEFIKWLKEQIG